MQEEYVGPCYPGAYILPNLISVAAVDNAGELGEFSNYGAETVAVAAPGVAILSTVGPYEENDYDYFEIMSGTSMAAPYVAGIAALMFSINPDLTSREAAEIIKTTGYDLESLQGKTSTGKMVNAYAAVMEAQNRLGETDEKPTETQTPTGEEPTETTEAPIEPTDYTETAGEPTESSEISEEVPSEPTVEPITSTETEPSEQYDSTEEPGATDEAPGETTDYTETTEEAIVTDEPVEKPTEMEKPTEVKDPTEQDETDEDDYKPGDVNGDGLVNVTDAILVLRHIVGLVNIDELHPGGMERATFHDGSPAPNVSHAIRILKIIVGLD